MLSWLEWVDVLLFPTWPPLTPWGVRFPLDLWLAVRVLLLTRCPPTVLQWGGCLFTAGWAWKSCSLVVSFLFFFFFLNFTILYWFCQILKWIRHRYTCVPHPEPSSLLPPHTIPLGHPSAPAPSIQYRASNLDWRLIPYMILYVFQCHSPKSSHPLPLPQSPMHTFIRIFVGENEENLIKWHKAGLL